MRITEFSITNFRSLRDFHIAELVPVNVLYGENDVGKSNVLAALQTIFCAKWQRTAADYRPGRFHEGEVRQFGSSFYKDTSAPITFVVRVAMDDDEIAKNLSPANTPLEVSKLAAAPLEIAGTISEPRILPRPSSAIRRPDTLGPPETVAKFRVTKLEWHKAVVFDATVEGDTVLPGQASGFFGLTPERYVEFFNRLTDYLTDSFQLVPPTRFVGPEKASPAETVLRPGNFKNALLQWSHGLPDTNRIQTFREVQRWFDGEPFGYGQINPFVVPIKGTTESMADVMVTRGGQALPLERYGTGVQQVLILLSYLLSDRKRRMLGIEEMELNLSPNTQDRILSQLRVAMENPELRLGQLFLTSHSEVFATKCPGRRYFLSMKNGATYVTSGQERESTKSQYLKVTQEECAECPTWMLTHAAKGTGPHDSPSFMDASLKDRTGAVEKEWHSQFCTRCSDASIPEHERSRIATARKVVESDGLRWPWPPAA